MLLDNSFAQKIKLQVFQTANILASHFDLRWENLAKFEVPQGIPFVEVNVTEALKLFLGTSNNILKVNLKG